MRSCVIMGYVTLLLSCQGANHSWNIMMKFLKTLHGHLTVGNFCTMYYCGWFSEHNQIVTVSNRINNYSQVIHIPLMQATRSEMDRIRNRELLSRVVLDFQTARFILNYCFSIWLIEQKCFLFTIYVELLQYSIPFLCWWYANIFQAWQ